MLKVNFAFDIETTAQFVFERYFYLGVIWK